MEVGLIGLGKMGSRMAERLLEQGYELKVTDIDIEAIKRITSKGAIGIMSSKELMNYLIRTRIVLASVPTKSMDSIVEEAYTEMSGGDILVDFSNSYFLDTQRRAEYLKRRWIWLVDVGISGGISGAREGACLFVGGEQDAVYQADPILKSLALNRTYTYFGKSGSGHLVKAAHNAEEHPHVDSSAEARIGLQKISDRYNLGIDLSKVGPAYANGSILAGTLNNYITSAIEKNPGLEGISGSVFGQSEAVSKKFIELAEECGVKMTCCRAAIEARVQSQKNETEVGKLINATRKEFGGHEEWKHGK